MNHRELITFWVEAYMDRIHGPRHPGDPDFATWLADVANDEDRDAGAVLAKIDNMDSWEALVAEVDSLRDHIAEHLLNTGPIPMWVVTPSDNPV